MEYIIFIFFADKRGGIFGATCVCMFVGGGEGGLGGEWGGSGPPVPW